MLESRALSGAVAQLGERRVRNAKVEGSIPFRSTELRALMRELCRILWGPLEHPRPEGRHHLPVYPRLQHHGAGRLRRTLEEDHFRPFLELDAVSLGANA